MSKLTIPAAPVVALHPIFVDAFGDIEMALFVQQICFERTGLDESAWVTITDQRFHATTRLTPKQLRRCRARASALGILEVQQRCVKGHAGTITRYRLDYPRAQALLDAASHGCPKGNHMGAQKETILPTPPTDGCPMGNHMGDQRATKMPAHPAPNTLVIENTQSCNQESALRDAGRETAAARIPPAAPPAPAPSISPVEDPLPVDDLAALGVLPPHPATGLHEMPAPGWCRHPRTGQVVAPLLAEFADYAHRHVRMKADAEGRRAPFRFIESADWHDLTLVEDVEEVLAGVKEKLSRCSERDWKEFLHLEVMQERLDAFRQAEGLRGSRLRLLKCQALERWKAIQTWKDREKPPPAPPDAPPILECSAPLDPERDRYTDLDDDARRRRFAARREVLTAGAGRE